MNSEIWTAIPVEAREVVDDLIRLDRRLSAVEELRESFPEGSRPGLYEALDAVIERYRELGRRFAPGPTEPLDPAALAEQAAKLPGRPVAVEAVWDGDSFGWMVGLLLITDDPAADYCLATIRHGGDLRVFNGTVPPWPEAQEVLRVGPALAERLGVPFHFASPDRPDDEARRWRESQGGAPS